MQSLLGEATGKLTTSDSEALGIAKNVLKLVGDEIERNGEHSGFCRELLASAIAGVRKGGSVRGEPV